MGKAARLKALRREVRDERRQMLIDLAEAGNVYAAQVLIVWATLKPREQITLAEYVAAKVYTDAYQAAGWPYGNHEHGFERWRIEQGYPERPRVTNMSLWQLVRYGDDLRQRMREAMEQTDG